MSAVIYQSLEDVIPSMYERGKDPFIILLDEVADVRNFGAVAYICEYAGADTIVTPARGSVSVDIDATEALAGILRVLPACKGKSIDQAIRSLQQSGVKVFTASEKATGNYMVVKCEGSVTIVMGAEDTGASPENLRIYDNMVEIPQFETIGFLNVSVATSILVYGVVRQRMNEQQ